MAAITGAVGTLGEAGADLTVDMDGVGFATTDNENLGRLWLEIKMKRRSFLNTDEPFFD
ncbi:MAG TPA: hypothetical protein VJ654_17975 [Noviherbaspirillum sp.]|nr:hypothetical protein [Noviherbaspirillum sp.]